MRGKYTAMAAEHGGGGGEFRSVLWSSTFASSCTIWPTTHHFTFVHISLASKHTHRPVHAGRVLVEQRVCLRVHHVWVLGAQRVGGAVGAAAHLGLCIKGEVAGVG